MLLGRCVGGQREQEPERKGAPRRRWRLASHITGGAIEGSGALVEARRQRLGVEAKARSSLRANRRLAFLTFCEAELAEHLALPSPSTKRADLPAERVDRGVPFENPSLPP